MLQDDPGWFGAIKQRLKQCLVKLAEVAPGSHRRPVNAVMVESLPSVRGRDLTGAETVEGAHRGQRAGECVRGCVGRGRLDQDVVARQTRPARPTFPFDVRQVG